MITHHILDIDGLRVFVREAGPMDAPAIVLLHGVPASSSTFRELMPLLADRFRVVAPDMIGFGHSDAPPADRFTYTFENLAEVTRKALDCLGVERYFLYMHGSGGLVGLSLAAPAPERVRGLAFQNVAAYDAWHRYFREWQPKTLVVLGRNDTFFLPAGAAALRRDLRDVETVFLDGSHFDFEEQAPAIAAHLTRVFGAAVAASTPFSSSPPAA
jgi:pimeloyl-ACP methyl ester carboxylesterase